jgi:hypothetical protein
VTIATSISTEIGEFQSLPGQARAQETGHLVV